MENQEDDENVPFCTRIQKMPFFGYITIVLAALFFSFRSVGVNLLKSYMHPIQALVISYFFVTFIYFTITVLGDCSFKPFPGEGRPLVVRAAFGAMTSVATYLVVTMMKLGDATAIMLSAPVYVTVIAFIFLGEPCEILHIVMIVLNFLGVILVTKPPFIFSHFSRTNETMNNSTAVDSSDRSAVVGFILANAVAIGSAILTVALRRLRKTPVSVSIFWTGIGIILISSSYLGILKDIRIPIESKPYFLLTFITVSVALAQQCQTVALRAEKAGPITLVRQVEVVFAFVEQVIILEQEVEWTSIVGATIVVSTVIFTGFYQVWRNGNKKVIDDTKLLTEKQKEKIRTASKPQLNVKESTLERSETGEETKVDDNNEQSNEETKSIQ